MQQGEPTMVFSRDGLATQKAALEFAVEQLQFDFFPLIGAGPPYFAAYWGALADPYETSPVGL